MSILTKASRLFSSRKRSLATNTVEHSRVDTVVLNDWRKQAPKLDEAFTEPPELKDGRDLDPKVWERMGEDLFYSYFDSAEPNVRQRHEVDPAYRVNRELADKNARDDQFREERPRTRMKPLESALGTMGALNSLRESYSNELAEHAERQQDIAEHANRLEDIDEEMESWREHRNQADDEGVVDIDRTMVELGQAKREVSAELKALEAEQAGKAAEITAAVKVAAHSAQEAAQEAIESAELLGGIGKSEGAGKRVSPETMFALAERARDSRVLRDVLDMMGRLKLDMGTVRRQQRKGGYEEIVDVELGRDMQVVLPSEKVLLMHPIGRLDFFRRYNEQSLMQYETWSEQELKRGPVIFITDGSDSMKGAKNIWCKGVALAGVDIAQREGRNAACVEFGSPGQMESFFFAKGGIDMTSAVAFAEHFFAGGTSILTGLREAQRMIREEAPFHAADLIIITDGQDDLTDEDREIRDELREMGVKLHGITIGIAPTTYMLEICDHTTPVHDVSGKNEASDSLAINIS